MLVILDDTEQDPDMDDHIDEDMRLHPLNADEVVHKLDEGSHLYYLEDSLDLELVTVVEILRVNVHVFAFVVGFLEYEHTRRAN